MSRLLFVSATAEEAAHLPEGVTVLVAGVGTMNTAVSLAAHLAKDAQNKPERIINVGTAGALRDDFSGVYEIHEVTQHDFSDGLVEAVTGQPVPNTRQLLPETGLPAARLATGDSFINDSSTRERLAGIADLVDMEGYAIARIGAAFDVPVTLVKHVSDRADEEAARSWRESVEVGAREVAEALQKKGWLD